MRRKMNVSQFSARFVECIQDRPSISRILPFLALNDQARRLLTDEVAHKRGQALVTCGDLLALGYVQRCRNAIAAGYLVDDLSSAAVGLRLEMPARLAGEAERTGEFADVAEVSGVDEGGAENVAPVPGGFVDEGVGAHRAVPYACSINRAV